MIWSAKLSETKIVIKEKFYSFDHESDFGGLLRFNEKKSHI